MLLMEWKDPSFGKKHNYFWITYAAALTLLAASGLGFFGIVKTESHVEVVAVGLATLFFLVFFIRAVEAIRIATYCVRTISIRNGLIQLKTFGGIQRSGKLLQVEPENHDTLKASVRFLFPASKKNMALRLDSGRFLISANMENHSSLIDELQKIGMSDQS